MTNVNKGLNLESLMKEVKIERSRYALTASIRMSESEATIIVPELNDSIGLFDLTHELGHAALALKRLEVLIPNPLFEFISMKLREGSRRENFDYDSHKVEYLADCIGVSLILSENNLDDSEETLDIIDSQMETESHPSPENRRDVIRFLKEGNYRILILREEEMMKYESNVDIQERNGGTEGETCSNQGRGKMGS